jgi:hypothetical protein
VKEFYFCEFRLLRRADETLVSGIMDLLGLRI